MDSTNINSFMGALNLEPNNFYSILKESYRYGNGNTMNSTSGGYTPSLSDSMLGEGAYDSGNEMNYQYTQMPQNNRREPLQGILPPEILHSLKENKELVYGPPAALMGNRQPQYAAPQNKMGQYDQILNQLVENVNLINKKLGLLNESTTQPQGNESLTLTINGEKYSGKIIQNKKGEIIFLVGGNKCFVLEPGNIRNLAVKKN